MDRDEQERKRIKEFEERRKRLLAIRESESYTLERQDWYDRIRYLRVEEGIAQQESYQNMRMDFTPTKRSWSGK